MNRNDIIDAKDSVRSAIAFTECAQFIADDIRQQAKAIDAEAHLNTQAILLRQTLAELNLALKLLTGILE